MFTTFLLKSLNLQHSFSGGWYVFSKTSADHFHIACMKEKCERMYAYEATNCFAGTGGAA